MEPVKRNKIKGYTGYDYKGYPIKLPHEKPLPRIDPSPFEMDVMDIFSEMEKLLLKKHKDYGPKNIAESPGGPLNGLRVRLHDKLARINNLIDRSWKLS